MFERFTDRARRVVVLAQEEARMLNHNYIGTEHILLGLIHEGEGVAAKALGLLGISLEAVRQQVEEIIGQGQQAPSGHIPFTPRAKKVLELSLREALQLGHNYVGTEHILLGLIREGEGVAAQVLVKLGADLNRVRQEVIQLLHGYQGKEPTWSGAGESPYVTSWRLDPIARKLTLVRDAERVVGRDNDVDRVLQVLSQQTKNNPVLVSESGAGKAAVLDGLAQKIIKYGMPENLGAKQIYVLDREQLMADGLAAFEVRLKDFIREVQTEGNVILFIDDLHTFLSVDSASPEATAMAAAFLNPMIGRGRLQIIGATTPDQYHSKLEADPLLARSLQAIHVAQLTVRETVAILKRSDAHEEHLFGIKITDDAWIIVVALAQFYVRGAPTPAKAVGPADELMTSLLTLPQHDVGDVDERKQTVALSIISEIFRKAGALPLYELHKKLKEVQRQKNNAVDALEFEKASALRDEERRLTAELVSAQKPTVTKINEEFVLEVLATVSGISARDLQKLADEVTPSVAHGVDFFESEQRYTLLNDQPLEGANGDFLGMDNTAAGIASLLTASRSASPVVVALDAGWGMGKSTLLRQIESRLSGLTGIVTVRFNAWTAEGENALEGLIKSVLNELDPNVVRRWARRTLARPRVVSFARIGFAVVTRFFGVARLVDELWNQLAIDAKTRNQLRNLIQGMLSDWVSSGSSRDPARALVVFIDDLDRCTDGVIVKVCEAVKLYLDAPGLIFVLACDLSVVARGVSMPGRGESAGRAYLEKIIQVVHRLPPPEEGQLDELIRGYAWRSGTTALIDRTVVRILIESAGRNPRKIKRIINSVVLENRLNPAWSLPPLNRAQLVTAILLQHLYSSFYELLINEGFDEDPIGDFLDYVDLRAGASNPPKEDNAWWSIADRIFQRHGMPAPARIPERGDRLTAQIKQLEQELPEDFPEFARSSALVALLRGVGDPDARLALRSQLMRRPLSVEMIREAVGETEIDDDVQP
jgi:hypothetical protein